MSENLEQMLDTKEIINIIELRNEVIDYEIFRKKCRIYLNNIEDFLKIAKNLNQEPSFYGNHPMHPFPHHKSTHFRYKGWDFDSNTKGRY